LSGSIPVELGNLSNLHYLYLGGSPMPGVGSASSKVGSKAILTSQDLKNNLLSAKTPTMQGGGGVVQNGNQLSGSIPTQLGKLANLEHLGLDYNQLSGSIPLELGKLKNLTRLWLNDNQLTGNVPAELGNLSSLNDLYLDWNTNLSGALPLTLDQLTGLSNFYYSNTRLCEPVNDADFQTWLDGIANRTGTYACSSSNSISGKIKAVGTGSPLSGVSLYTLDGFSTTTKADGTYTLDSLDAGQYFVIPASTGYTFTPSSLTISVPPTATGRNFTATAGAFSCANVHEISLAECTALAALFNNTTGSSWTHNTGWKATSLPCEWYGVTCSNGHVTALNLGYNHLSGPLPAELGNLTSLTNLELFSNQLSGSLPTQLGSLTKLTGLDMGGNKLSGSIPTQLGSLAKLTWLNLSHNQLSGSIPTQLGNLTQLSWLDMSSNNLSGPLPTQMGSLVELWDLELNSNPNLSGPLPYSLENLTNLFIFAYNGTGLCEAPDSGFPAWLDSITNRAGTTVCSYAISGAVTNGTTAVSGVTLSIRDGNGSTSSQADGSYTLNNLAMNSYTVVPSKLGYTFTPSSFTVSVPPSATGRNFSATPPAIPGVPALLTPTSASFSASPTPTFTWGSATNSTQYEIQIANNAVFTNPTLVDVTLAPDVMSYTAPKLTDGLWYWRVRGYNIIGQPGTWAAVRTLTVDTLKPLAPVLSTPADKGFANSTPAFTWLASATAAAYQFEYTLSSDSGFADPKYTSGWVSVLTHTPPTMAVSEYYWHVRAMDAAGNISSSWSTARLIKIHTPLPAAPALTTLTNAFVSASSTPTFTWASSTNAAAYEIQIANNAAFTSPILVDGMPGAGVQTYTAAKLADGLWYWRVRGLNNFGDPGAWATAYTFTVDTTPPPAPVLSTPLTNTIVRSTPAFTWAAAATAAAYQFQYTLASDSGFADPKYTSGWISVLTHTPPAMELGDYIWHVQAMDAVGNISRSWSLPLVIKVHPPLPAAPALTTLTNAFISASSTPTFTWSSTTNAAAYEIQIANNATFTSPILVDGMPGAGVQTYTAAKLADGLWYWRVRGLNSFGDPGAWATAYTFTVDTTPPLAPVLSTPLTNTIVRSTPAFTWAAAATAAAYQFEYTLASDSGFTDPKKYTSGWISVLTHTPPAMALGDYIWHVQAKDAVGNISKTWSLPFVIKVHPPLPAAPALTLLTNASFSVSSTPTFTWASVPNGAAYEIQIANNAAFTTPAQDKTLEAGVQTYTAATLTDSLWYWRVRGLNSFGDTGAWATAYTFTVDTIPPLAPVLSTPANNTIARGNPAFTWAAAATAAAYRFQYTLPEDSGFADPKYTSGWISTTSHTAVPPIDLGTTIWHVQARDAAGNISKTWSLPFTVTIYPIIPAAPVLLLPAASALSKNDAPLFSWNSTPAGVTYQLQIDHLATFSNPIQKHSTDLSDLTYQATPLTDGVWYWRVQAVNVRSEAGPWSAYRSIVIDTKAPAAPVLSLPGDNVTIRTTPTFAWTAAASASSYQFEYAANSEYGADGGFGSPIFNSDWVNATSSTPPAMTPGIYFWHVAARDAAGNAGSWSATRTLHINPPLPAAPVLTAPAAAVTTNINKPVFSWSSASSGVTYEIQIADSPAFTSPQDVTGATGVLTYTASTLSDRLWYWRVRAKNSYSEPGPWSGYRSLVVDTTPPGAVPLLSPTDASFSRTNPTFSWGPIATAATYQFEYASDSGFTSVVYTSAWLNTTSILPPKMALGSYYWHVRAADAVGNPGGWSAMRTIEIKPPIPAAPALITPAALAATGDNTPTFSWGKSASGMTYQIQIDNVPAFNSAKLQTLPEGTVALTYTATTLDDGVWYWHVQGINATNEAGAWSASRSFTVDTTPPAAPALSSPTHNAILRSTPAFSWAAAATAVSYQFEYDDDVDLSSPVYTSVWQSSTSHTPPTLATGVYSWSVRAMDAVGNIGKWSTPNTMKVYPPIPAAPALLSPAAAAVTRDTTQTFTWGTIANGSTYTIQIDSDPSFAHPEQSETGGIGVLSYTASALTGGVWYWRVQAINENNEPGVWAAYRSLTVDTSATAAPALSSPADNKINRGTPAFTWLAATNAATYQFEYATDSGFTNVVYTSAWLTTLTTTPLAMANGTYYWHVRGRDSVPNMGSWSNGRLINIYPPLPGLPLVTGPAASAVLSNSSPVLSWTSAANAAAYEVQIDTVNSFAHPAQDISGSDLTYTASPLTDGVWYWRVWALNSYNEPGTSTAASSFTVDTTPPAAPALSVPADTTIVRSTPAFSWLAAATAINYQFQYDNDPEFGSPTYTSAWITTLTATPTAMSLGTYYWHVRARDAVGNVGDWSPSRIIDMYPPIPAAPTLINLAASALTNNNTPTFTWSDSAASVGNTTYEIEIDDVLTFVHPEQSGLDLGLLSYKAAPTLHDGLWYWHIRGVNSYKEPGAWAAYRSFTIDTVAPTAPLLSVPANNTLSRSTPAFAWLASATAVSYQFQYDDNSDFSSPTYTSAWITTLSTTLPTMAPGTYSWRVQAKDAAGNISDWSTANLIRMYPIPPPANIVLNPGFNLGTTYAPTNWAWAPYTGACSKMVYNDAVNAHTGPNFLATGSSNNYASCQSVYQNIPATVTSGDAYTVGIWLKSPWASQTLSYSLEWTGGTSPVIATQTVNLDKTWQCFQTTLNIPVPGNNNAFRVSVNLPNRNLDVDIDDVYLTKGNYQICP